jgi:SagB-type dehydrogenase family enzyme
MSYLQTNNLVKIRFPSSFTKNYWTIEEKSKKTIFAVPKLAVLIALACAKPMTKDDLLDFLLDKQQADRDKIEKTLDSLLSKNIILSSEIFPQSNAWMNWKKSGWEAAADYHFFTWDAPFLDYSKDGGGHDRDRKNMVQYQEAQPDDQRCKVYKEFLDRQNLPVPTEFASLEIKNLLLSDKIKLLLSLAFGKKGEKACHWSDVPLIRRTSPSGGSRHPTEGYFLSHTYGISKGWHHIQADPASLVYLSPLSQEVDFLENESSAHLGAIVLTSIFERNMYRYREPRTFRTIHMDAGHILETIESAGNELGFEIKVSMNFDENAILKKIKASKFEEGVMAIVTLKEKI